MYVNNDTVAAYHLEIQSETECPKCGAKRGEQCGYEGKWRRVYLRQHHAARRAWHRRKKKRAYRAVI
jgi:hypothetical protein